MNTEFNENQIPVSSDNNNTLNNQNTIPNNSTAQPSQLENIFNNVLNEQANQFGVVNNNVYQNQVPVQPVEQTPVQPQPVESVPVQEQVVTPTVTTPVEVTREVSPIEEVKYEPIVENTPVSQVEPVEVVSNEINNTEVEVKKEKALPAAERNFKLTSTLLILFFVFLLTFILVMPYVGGWISAVKEKFSSNKSNSSVVEKNNNTNQTPTTDKKETEKLEIVSCKAQPVVTDSYIKYSTKKYYYNENNEVINYSEINSYIFTAEDPLYAEVVEECDKSLNYINEPGYTISCYIDESNIETESIFELKDFKTITDINFTIKADVTYKKKLETVKTELTDAGYTCG